MKTALITGASRGIGKKISETFKANGYNVIETYNTTPIENGIKLDISDTADVIRKIEQIALQCGQIDVLVNNAGISQRKNFLELDEHDWDTMLNTNLRGTFMVTQQVLKYMLPVKYGKVINIASIGGQWGGREQVHYAASKAALINFTQSISKMYCDQGINSNCVSPGIISTDMLPESYRLTDGVPCGTIGSAEDVANAVLFLASDKSNYIHGQTISVNGGMYYG